MLIRRVGMQLQFQKQISDKLKCEPTRGHTGSHLPTTRVSILQISVPSMWGGGRGRGLGGGRAKGVLPLRDLGKGLCRIL